MVNKTIWIIPILVLSVVIIQAFLYQPILEYGKPLGAVLEADYVACTLGRPSCNPDEMDCNPIKSFSTYNLTFQITVKENHTIQGEYFDMWGLGRSFPFIIEKEYHAGQVFQAVLEVENTTDIRDDKNDYTIIKYCRTSFGDCKIIFNRTINFGCV